VAYPAGGVAVAGPWIEERVSEKPDGADESPSDDVVEPSEVEPTRRASLRKQDAADGAARTVPDPDDETPDEVDDADEDADQADSERELVGATAGSARAAARRSAGVRAGSTASKGAATRTRTSATTEKLSIWARLLRFFREVVGELRKTIWPARNQMVTYTIVVIVFVVFMVALVAGLDLLFSWGVLKIFG
jgi:preprotein translocase subunit SecE